MEQELIITYWLVAGVVFLFAEIGLPGVGLLFAGCGALTVGMLLNFSIISLDDKLLQIVYFFVATALWMFVLWKPMQKLKLGKHKAGYNNIIGQDVTVGRNGLDKIHGGDVLWSGTIMKAKLSEDCAMDNLESGTVVMVKDIIGNVLIVTTK